MRGVFPNLYRPPQTSGFGLRWLRICSNKGSQDDGISTDLVETLVKFKSRHNYIRVLEVSRTADHSFRGSRLLLLDSPGNIHSISFLFQTLINTYFDIFATLPPLLPLGPIALLGFGAGSAAKILLKLYPDCVEIHGWEIDPAVVGVARDYFGVARLEKLFPNKLWVHVGDALEASVRGGFAGILVDLFSKGSLVEGLQEEATWRAFRGRLREGCQIMVNVGGSCVEAEESGREGKAVMEETLRAMEAASFELNVLRLGNRGDDSSVALTGALPSPLSLWEAKLPNPLKPYAHMWTPYNKPKLN